MTFYFVSIATYVGFFMIMALALNLQWGMTGMVNFGVAGFYAIGAYTSGLLSVKAGWPVEWAMLAAPVMGLIWGAAVALLSIRLREDFLAIVTLGFLPRSGCRHRTDHIPDKRTHPPQPLWTGPARHSRG